VITVRGELSAAARTLNVGGGRPTVLQEKAPSERIVCTYVYVPGMGDGPCPLCAFPTYNMRTR
jgi:hypothetical protein